ncbi:MAG: hypothetical protein GY757_62395 [bacterium]|nr:hypothetical protein [bacterium]
MLDGVNSIGTVLHSNSPQKVDTSASSGGTLKSSPNVMLTTEFNEKVQGNLTGQFAVKESSQLTLREKLQVQQLELMERSVREHEKTHLRTARNLASTGPSYEYQKGPDGNKYVVGGEVNVNASPVGGDPDATIEKALRVQRTALAPADPSPQDRAAATKAKIIENKAHRIKSREAMKEAMIKKPEPGEVPQPNINNAYDKKMDVQDNLFKILDLFS